MVSDLAIGALTVLGGAISGVIGVVYSEYQSRRERQRELKEWYNTTIQLGKRVERLGSDNFEGSAEYVADALSGVIGRLTSQLMDAPRGADMEVVEAGEAFASDCEKARKFLRAERMINARSEYAHENPDRASPLEAAIESAENMRIRAENAREEVSWL